VLAATWLLYIYLKGENAIPIIPISDLFLQRSFSNRSLFSVVYSVKANDAPIFTAQCVLNQYLA